MSPATLELITGVPVMVAWNLFLWLPMERWVIKGLRGTPEVVNGVLAGLFAGSFCIVPSVTQHMEFSVLRWLLDWPGFFALITLTLACITAPGQPLAEGRERVPVFAMAGPIGSASGTSSPYNRFVRWLDRPWRRVAFRGAIALICACAVCIARGAQLRPLIVIALYIVLRVVGVGWYTGPGRPQP